MIEGNNWAYLGKTKLYNFLKAEGFTIPRVMRDTEYKKYRGDEWLKCDDVELFAVRGKRISVSVYVYDEATDKRHETEYDCYTLFAGVWKKYYQRIGKTIKIEKV